MLTPDVNIDRCISRIADRCRSITKFEGLTTANIAHDQLREKVYEVVEYAIEDIDEAIEDIDEAIIETLEPEILKKGTLLKLYVMLDNILSGIK